MPGTKHLQPARNLWRSKESLSIESVYAKICSHEKLSTDFAKHSFIVENSKAIEHTVELASGLLSQMIGETEILGQNETNLSKSKRTWENSKTLKSAILKKAFRVQNSFVQKPA